MKNRIILSVGILSLLSIKLLALDGRHSGLAQSSLLEGAICVYCHTPHSANSGTSDKPTPIWNKAKSPLTFNMYGGTIAGTETETKPNSPSLACLSCHDGVSAMNAVVNAPGSGYTSNFAVNPLAPGTVLLNANLGTYIDRMVQTPTKAVGFDGMQNDHPISIEYIEGRGSLKPVETSLSGWLGATQISDLLRNGNVECVSCHDPHNDNNRLYRRVDNADGSVLCFGFHDK